MKYLLKISFAVVLLMVSSCRLTDLDANLENPNEVNVANLDVNLLMNKIQLDFADFVAETNEPTFELTRMLAMTGGDTYALSYQAQAFNDIWGSSYQKTLINIKTLRGRTDGTGLTVHSASARILEAYIAITLADVFGDVPFSQALDPNNFNPGADDDKQIYADAITLLDEAITLLGQTSTATLTRDIYYGGSKAKWIALANTLKLKAYMNLRLTDSSAKGKIEALLASDLIDSDGEEFTYKYGTADVPARSRHPQYREMYQPQEGSASTYLGNHFMLQAYNGLGVEDPRWRYYFYRQVGSLDKALADDPESIPCVFAPRPPHYSQSDAWCAFDPGFFGRDHGNADGTPPDSRAKTCWGIYPAGGLADTNDGNVNFQVVTVQGQGANGAGILPIWMASFTEYLKAEAILTLGVAGDAKATLLGAVGKSITRTRAFAESKGQGLPAGLEPSEAVYTAKVSEVYDAAGSDAGRMAVAAREYYIALWGNGIEAYNLYRRTGKPDLQPVRAANPGFFVRSFLYPSDYANLNSSVTQKIPTAANKVFWDNNPDNFIK